MNEGACSKVHESEMMCDPKRVTEARAVCGRCTQQDSCYDWAVRTGQEWCVHAGLQFTHEIKRLLATAPKVGTVMVQVRLMNSVTAYGNVGDVAELPYKLAENFVNSGYAETLDGGPIGPDVGAAAVEAEAPVVDEVDDDPEIAEIQALLDADNEEEEEVAPVVRDELPADHSAA